jgi:hypothetical protein
VVGVYGARDKPFTELRDRVDGGLGDDLATHINTEIVLGIIRSRSDAVAWYQRTLHAHLGEAMLDPGQAVDALVQGRFARERERS